MNIPSYGVIILNIILIAIYLVCMISLFRKGFVYGIFKLLSTIGALLIAWITAPVLQGLFTFITFKKEYGLKLEALINTVIWFFVIFIVIKLFCFILTPLFKKFTKVPVLGIFNRILGLLLGFVNATIIVLILSTLLKTPLVENAYEVKEKSYFKYVDNLSSKCLEYVIDNIDASKIQEGVEGFDVDSTRTQLKTWLKQQGIINE